MGDRGAYLVPYAPSHSSPLGTSVLLPGTLSSTHLGRIGKKQHFQERAMDIYSSIAKEDSGVLYDVPGGHGHSGWKIPTMRDDNKYFRVGHNAGRASPSVQNWMNDGSLPSPRPRTALYVDQEELELCQCIFSILLKWRPWLQDTLCWGGIYVEKDDSNRGELFREIMY